MKFTLGWLRDHLETEAGLAEITDRLTGIGLELEGVSDPGAALAPFRVAAVLDGGAAPERGPAARLHGGCGRGSGERGVRRAERPGGDEGGVRAAGRVHPGHRHHAEGGRDPRRASAGMLLQPAGDGAGRQP